MKKNSLTPNSGLSLSQAQSISNLCYQRAMKIEGELSTVNNFSKTIKVNKEEKTIKKAIPLPKNVVDLLREKATLHACQAFLMENIKAKDEMLNEAKKGVADVSTVERPKEPDFVEFDEIPAVGEAFGWDQLTASENNKYHEAEAFAAHIGKFIHKDGHLDRLREELPHIPDIEWFEVEDGKKTPVTITKHHDADQLLRVHEELAALHREYEQKVNYFKSKVKNLTTAENARIAKENADKQAEAQKTNENLRTEYRNAMKDYQEKVRKVRGDFEIQRQARIAEIASMRITVDPIFQRTVDEFKAKLPESQE